MHVIFGISALVMLVGTIWMLAKDHNREWRKWQLDDRASDVRIDVARHGARQHPARRGDRTHRERLFDPGPDECHLVQEPNAVALLEAADTPFEFLFKHLEGKQRHCRNTTKLCANSARYR